MTSRRLPKCVWKWGRIYPGSYDHIVDIRFEEELKYAVGLCKFNDLDLLAPIDAETWLTGFFGEDYMTPDRPTAVVT